ncbi:hypothetical protein [Falsiroseomonas sp. CW058]|uniref:hypothetical protein n=1 Tax=Falsiroseomonas sp. CW058 TaxID=3388664 RepID=UPI003D31B3E6
MAPPPEIARMERDLPFQRRTWRAQRVGWAAMAMLVAAALAGLFGGGGWLAAGEAEDGGLRAEWPRIQRLGLAEPLRMVLPAADGLAELRLDAGAAARWRLRDATPPPLDAAAGPGGLVLRIGRDGAGPAAIVLHLEPIGAPGPRRLRVESGGRALDLPIFVWP